MTMQRYAASMLPPDSGQYGSNLILERICEISDANLETEEIKKTKLQPLTIVQNGRIKAKWSVKDVTQGRSFRFQW